MAPPRGRAVSRLAIRQGFGSCGLSSKRGRGGRNPDRDAIRRRLLLATRAGPRAAVPATRLLAVRTPAFAATTGHPPDDAPRRAARTLEARGGTGDSYTSARPQVAPAARRARRLQRDAKAHGATSLPVIIPARAAKRHAGVDGPANCRRNRGAAPSACCKAAAALPAMPASPSPRRPSAPCARTAGPVRAGCRRDRIDPGRGSRSRGSPRPRGDRGVRKRRGRGANVCVDR